MCSFGLTNQCTRGNSCKFNNTHGMITINVNLSATPNHEHICCLNMVNTAQGPVILTGSRDKSVKGFLVNNKNSFSLLSNVANAGNLLSPIGSVRNIEINDGTLMWAVQEPLKYTEIDNMPLLQYSSSDDADLNVGIVYLVDESNMTNKLPLHISPDRPYTHSQQVRSFIIAKIDGQMFVMTGGGEGTIRFWKFDPISTTFKLLNSLEGHLRDITALWYDEGGENGLLWSGSTDRTIRVWRVNNGECIATLVLSTDATGQTTPGHDGVISCFEKVTIDDTIYLASGGGDGNVIIWNTTDGSYAQHCSHGNVFISAMKTVTDPSGTSLLVIAVTNGKLYLRALDNDMTLLCVLENGCQRNFVWGIVDLYGLVPVNNESPSCFVTAGDDGKLILWSINASLLS